MVGVPFFGKLEQRASDSLLCIGLDPRDKTAAEAKAKCIAVIDATAQYAAAYKPNAAFFEVYGAEGWTALRDVIRHVPKHIPVILDAKRGDIADTAAAYATSAFQHLEADCITVSPYMGRDSLEPFTKDPRYGVFALCKTSNKAANELQALNVSGSSSGERLFETVARVAQTSWNTNNNVGLVVGATDPAALAAVRRAAPKLWFLVPGVGAQGGNLEQALRAGLRDDAKGMLINVSRAVYNAANPGAAAKKLHGEINAVRATLNTNEPLSSSLLRSKCVRFGSFKLKSGLISPIYLDLRRLVTYPDVLKTVAKEYAKMLNTMEFDRLVGLPYAALPIATAVSLEMNRPLIYPRKETKQYGTKAAIEGEHKAGEKVVVIDDLVTTGETKIEAIEKLEAAGLKVVSIVVLIDREMGATQFLGDRGYNFRAVTNISQLLEKWKSSSAITGQQYNDVLKFMGRSASKL